jgi:hypothetical protein
MQVIASFIFFSWKSEHVRRAARAVRYYKTHPKIITSTHDRQNPPEPVFARRVGCERDGLYYPSPVI